MAGSTLITKKEVSTEVEFDLETQSLAEFFHDGGYTAIKKDPETGLGIKFSAKNNVPYLTFLHGTEKTEDGKSSAKNFYFTKKCSENGLIDTDTMELENFGDVSLTELTPEFFAQFQMVFARCESKDVYTGTGNKKKLTEEGWEWKICPKGNGNSLFASLTGLF